MSHSVDWSYTTKMTMTLTLFFFSLKPVEPLTPRSVEVEQQSESAVHHA